MNSHLLIPKIGLRFLLTGTPYEVSWTSQGMVRYSAIAGGKSTQLVSKNLLKNIIQVRSH
jgi:hypothetical protein